MTTTRFLTGSLEKQLCPVRSRLGAVRWCCCRSLIRTRSTASALQELNLEEASPECVINSQYNMRASSNGAPYDCTLVDGTSLQVRTRHHDAEPIQSKRTPGCRSGSTAILKFRTHYCRRCTVCRLADSGLSIEPRCVPHSVRSATIGSILAALRAGNNAAAGASPFRRRSLFGRRKFRPRQEGRGGWASG